MQFGIFSVGDVTPDPTTVGKTPSEHECIEAGWSPYALRAEELGLDVLATGEHHNPPFVPSSPTTMLGFIAARTERIILSTATTLITTNDPVKLAEDYAMLQHLAGGRVDLMLGRGQHGARLPLVRAGHPERHPALGRELRPAAPPVARGCGRLAGPIPNPVDGLHVDTPAARWHPAVRVARLDPSPEIAEQAAYYGDGFFHNNIFWPKEHTERMVRLYRQRFEHYGHGPADQAIVGLGGQVFMRPNSQDAVREFRPYFDKAPVYGGGPSLEDFMAQTPLTVGSPQEVIDRTLSFRDYVGDYQRQLFLIDHAGLPQSVVFEQLEMLGELVVPVLRREFAAVRAPNAPDAPVHPRVAAKLPVAAGTGAV